MIINLCRVAWNNPFPFEVELSCISRIKTLLRSPGSPGGRLAGFQEPKIWYYFGDLFLVCLVRILRRLSYLVPINVSYEDRVTIRHFADDIFKCIFLNENMWIANKISIMFVPKGPIVSMVALVQIMACVSCIIWPNCRWRDLLWCPRSGNLNLLSPTTDLWTPIRSRRWN